MAPLFYSCIIMMIAVRQFDMQPNQCLLVCDLFELAVVRLYIILLRYNCRDGCWIQAVYIISFSDLKNCVCSVYYNIKHLYTFTQLSYTLPVHFVIVKNSYTLSVASLRLSNKICEVTDYCELLADHFVALACLV